MARKMVEEKIREARRATVLSLQSAHLKELPPEIAQLTGLRALYIHTNQLVELPLEISQLTELRALYLHRNQLAELPAEIGQLTELAKLYIHENKLTRLPAEIGQLTELARLHIHENKLTRLPAEIGQLTKLQSLQLSNNQLVELPAEIGQLTDLRSLQLSNNQLKELPAGIGHLTRLQMLDLSNNQLAELPAEFQNLTSLERLILHRNNALGIPPEILGPERGAYGNDAKPADILAYYFKSRTEDSNPLLEAKLLILGQGAVGKTSLVKQLVHGIFNPHEEKTDGIEINRWHIPGKDDQKIRVNIWDFGGQEIMHATHQFFLTKRSLYLVVLDARKGENENNIFYWLRIIESFGGDSPVLVVTNKNEGTNNLDLDERRLCKDYPSIRGFFETSCKTGDGVGELKAAIHEQIGNLGHVYDRVPKSFLDTKVDLEDQTESKDYLEIREYRNICQAYEINDTGEQDRLLRFLHDLGVVLHFEDPEGLYRLDETKILNPQWVTNGVYRILNDSQLTRKGGVLDVRDVNRILTPKAGYPKAARLFILGMMKKFELCYLGYQTDERYLVPELLPKTEPDLDLETSDGLRFAYHYELLPEGVLPRFIVRMHPHLKEELVWKRGALLEVDGNQALVRADIQAGRVFVSIFGESGGRRRALTAIRAEFRAIHRTIPGLRGKEMIPLPDSPEQTVGYKHLLLLEKQGKRRHWPEGAVREYSVSELLDGVEPREDRRQRMEELMSLAVRPNVYIDQRQQTFQVDARQVHISSGDLERLTGELAQLKQALFERDEYDALASIGKAEAAAEEGDGETTAKWLQEAGKVAYEVAKDVSTDLLAETMKKTLGLG